MLASSFTGVPRCRASCPGWTFGLEQKACRNGIASVPNDSAELPVLEPQTSVAAEPSTGKEKSDFLKN